MPHSFLSDEVGAVTVDWVVLTAALVGLGLAVMGVVSTGVQTASERLAAQLRNDMINTRFVEDEGDPLGFDNEALNN